MGSLGGLFMMHLLSLMAAMSVAPTAVEEETYELRVYIKGMS